MSAGRSGGPGSLGGVCLFDDVADGHHRAYLTGLVTAAVNEGYEVVAASPTRLAYSAPSFRWLQVPEAGTRDVRTARRTLRRAIDVCSSGRIGSFVDLYLDKNVWAIPRTIRGMEKVVHVLHHAHQYVYEGRTVSGRVRTALLRRRLRGLAARGARIVVHTERALEIARCATGVDRAVLVGYPVRMSTEDKVLDYQVPAADSEVLFVGQARREKGLSDLLDALEPVKNVVRLRVVGPQKPQVIGSLMERHPSLCVRWDTRFLDDTELRGIMRGASLVALPYRTEFGRHGGASGVLLEAMAVGAPVVATSALSAQLPEGYRGAVVVPNGDTALLTSGVVHALERSHTMRREAEIAGPTFIRTHHTYDNYIREILR